MLRQLKIWLSVLIALPLAGTIAGTAPAAAAAAAMTNYRVYQNDKPLREFATEKQAVAYAKRFAYSHVEKIADRAWMWDNFPRFKIYQGGMSKAGWEFRTYAEALAAAKQLNNVHIRDLEQPGWVYQSYANYRLFQGEKTKSGWTFATLDAAKKEAKKWANAHIIELSSNTWAWDNLNALQEATQRAGKAVYAIVSPDGTSASDRTYGYLHDAIQASAALGDTNVVNTSTGAVVHSNVRAYEVLQSGTTLGSFISLSKAVQFAKGYANASVVYNGETWWTSVPYLTVYQGDKKLKSFHTVTAAVRYAKGYAGSAVKNADGRTLWSNAKRLVYLAWNGETTSADVLGQVANTQGLSVDSPTWFELADDGGTLKDTSDASVVRTLAEAGIEVMPLVHNQFDQQLTTRFLASDAAQKTFISGLVSKLAELNVSGVNLDFENVSKDDRSAFTKFVTALASAVHAKGMKLSIDLPRGDVKWNHLTAYDHAALANVVDTMIIMAYDEHWTGSKEPGSVAGLAWTEEGVRQFLSYGIPRGKLMLGIPFYVRVWQLDGSGKLVGSRAVYMKDIGRLISETGAAGVKDAESGQMKYTYKQNGYTYQFWAETPETTAARVNIAKKYDLAGVAAWRLGYEDASLWTMMLQMK